MSNDYGAKFINKMKSLRMSGRYADWSIRCGDGRQFPVHKAMVCKQSKVLAAAEKRQTKKGEVGPHVHEEFDSDTVDRMLWFLYGCDYDLSGVADKPGQCLEVVKASSSVKEPAPEPAPEPYVDQPEQEDERYDDDGDGDESDADEIEFINERLKAHVRVYAIADSYDIADLRTLAVSKFQQEADVGWAIDGFGGVVSEVYARTSHLNSNLRDALLCVALRHVSELIRHPRFMRTIAEDPNIQGFGVLLLANVASGNSVQKSSGKYTYTQGQSSKGSLSVGWFDENEGEDFTAFRL